MKEDKTGCQKDEPIERLYINYDPNINLPAHEDILYNQEEKEVKKLASEVYVNNEDNQNLTLTQKELLLWQFRLGYIGFQNVQWLIHTGRMKVHRNSKAVATCEIPKFAACKFGKGHYRPDKMNTTKNNPMKEKELKRDHIITGKMVSEDQYISKALDRLYHKRGKPAPYDMFSGIFIFIDYSSGCTRIKNQVDITATKTVKAKINSEMEAKSQ